MILVVYIYKYNTDRYHLFDDIISIVYSYITINITFVQIMNIPIITKIAISKWKAHLIFIFMTFGANDVYSDNKNNIDNNTW